MTNITNIFHEIQYLAAPREDDRPDVAAVEVLGAVEEHAGRLHGHGGHLRGWEKFVVRTLYSKGRIFVTIGM